LKYVDSDLLYGQELISFNVKHNVNDDVLVLVVTSIGVEKASNRVGFTSDTEASSWMCAQTLEAWIIMEPIYSPEPVESVIMRGMSDGGFPLT
jgi:hypothetical protein